jgi:hypothetical protein
VQTAHGKRDAFAREVPELSVVAGHPRLGHGHVLQAVDVGVDEVPRLGLRQRVSHIAPELCIPYRNGLTSEIAVENTFVPGVDPIEDCPIR